MKKNKKLLISIIIPSYNRAELISHTLKSVIQQTYKNWELIIVDDGSLDNTREVVKPFLNDDRIFFVDRPKDRLRGGNAARNYGMKLAKGEYIKWLDSDDLLAPHCFAKQIGFLEQDDYDVVLSRSRFFSVQDEQGNFTWDKYWSKSFTLRHPFKNYLFGKIRFSTADALWKKKFLGEAPFKEDLRNSQEWLMYIQQLAKEPKYFLDAEVLVYSRLHGGQMHNEKGIALHYKNQIFARHCAIAYLISKNKLSYPAFKYLYKNMLVNFLAPLKKGKVKYFGTNLFLLIKTAFRGALLIFK